MENKYTSARVFEKKNIYQSLSKLPIKQENLRKFEKVVKFQKETDERLKKFL